MDKEPAVAKRSRDKAAFHLAEERVNVDKQFATGPIRRPLRGSLCCSRPDKQQQHDVRPSLLVVPVAAQSGSVTRCWFRVKPRGISLIGVRDAERRWLERRLALHMQRRSTGGQDVRIDRCA